MTKEEQIILRYFVDEMEKAGKKQNFIILTFDESLIDEMNKIYSTKITLVSIEQLINKLLSGGYIQNSYHGSRLENLQITTKGIGVVNSIKAKEEQVKNKSLIKKISDWIEEHKGLVTIIGLLLAFITVMFKLREF